MFSVRQVWAHSQLPMAAQLKWTAHTWRQTWRQPLCWSLSRSTAAGCSPTSATWPVRHCLSLLTHEYSHSGSLGEYSFALLSRSSCYIGIRAGYEGAGGGQLMSVRGGPASLPNLPSDACLRCHFQEMQMRDDCGSCAKACWAR